MKLLRTLFFLFLTLISFASCDKKMSKTPKTRYLRINLPGDPKTMDPRKGGDVYSSAMHFLLFEGLTKVSEHSTSDLGIAKKIDLSDDMLTYTFHLRDTQWSNGQPVTAQDFEYSWKTMLSPSFPCPNANLLYPIKNAEKAKNGLVPTSEIGIRVIDSKTLEIVLESPTPYFLNLISFCVFYPVNHNVVRENPKWCDNFNEDFISNGPYKIIKWRHDDEIVLVKNEHYYDKDEVKLAGIHISLVDNENTALEMFKRKELDLLGSPYTNVTIDASNYLAHHNFLNCNKVGKTEFCAFNVNKPPFNNIHIRKAMAYAINRDSVVQTVGMEDEMPAINFVPPVLKKGKNIPFIKSFDPIKAREELEIGLKELNMDLRDFEKITMVYPKYEVSHKIAQVLQQQWRENLGILVKIESVDHVMFLTKTSKKDFDLCQYYWVAQYDDQMNILDRFKKKLNPKNYAGWENEQYIQLLNDSYFVTGDKRDQLLEEAESIIMKEMPIAPIYHGCSYCIKQPYVKGMFTSAIGSVHLHKIQFEDEMLAKK